MTDSKIKRFGDRIKAELWYPRVEGNAREILIDLIDVRAADPVLVRYDFTRDGWSILQASRFSWPADDPVCDPDWQEVAFVRAWGREETGEIEDI